MPDFLRSWEQALGDQMFRALNKAIQTGQGILR